MRHKREEFCPLSLRHAALVLAAGMALASPAQAESFDLWGIPLEYKTVLSYAVALRMEDQEQALINGPIDPIQFQSDGKFTHTGLSTTINFDDANRNFNQFSLLNNRASLYGEVRFGGDNFGIVGSGAGFYDLVFQNSNDNNSPDTVNNDLEAARSGYRTLPVDSFTPEAVETSGERIRLLEAYAYANGSIGDSLNINVRGGRHLAAWGESLFFPGIVSAQGPFDATKAFVPGAEVKEILLPTNQISFSMSIGSDLTLLGQYQFEFEPTEIFPMGDFFSPADLVGPGATFGYGSINPAYTAPGTNPCNPLPTNPTAVIICAASVGGGVGQTTGLLTNVPRFILITREPDILPKDSDKPWGLGLKYQLTQNFNLGAYYLHYHNHNPSVQLNMGYASFGDVAGQPLTTQILDQRVPVTYNVKYADDITMTGITFSTVFWVFNIAGEITRRENIDMSVAADISGVRSPVGTRGNVSQIDLSFLYVNNPNFLFYDEVVVVGEAGWLKVDDVDRFPEEDGINLVGNGDYLFYDTDAGAVQVLVAPKGRNIFSGWDLATPISFAYLHKNPSVPGTFGSLYGDGDTRFSVGLTLQYLQNLEFSTTYNGFLGDPNKHIGPSTLKANPYVDHDYLSFTIKYSL